MNINRNNYNQYTFFTLILISISGSLGYLLFLIFSNSFNRLPSLIQILISIPSVPTIYSGLFLIFDRYLWKLKIFKVTGIVVAHDLNGKWKGNILSSWDGLKTEIPAELNIQQTATSIKIYGTFNESKSISMHEYFGLNDIDNQTALYYFYKNDPKYNAPATMAMHEGSAILTYDPEKKLLSGYYYSGRDRHNHGIINVKRI